MDKIIIAFTPAHAKLFEIKDFPELSSKNQLVRKGIGILRQYMPSVLRYLSMQRILAHLADYLIEIRLDDEIPENEIKRRLDSWLRRKRNRRLLYVILELLLMPFTAFVALLPGPNVVFYGLFVLFYFHMKTFLNLRKINSENLNISLQKN